MSARPSARRRRKPLPDLRRPLFALGAIGVLGALLALVGWAQTPHARMRMADQGLPGQQSYARARIDDALHNGIVAAGVAADSVVFAQGWHGAPDVIRLQAPAGLVQLNLALSEAVQVAGGRVLRGERHRDDSGEWLELRFGTASGMTHRVVARRERIAPVPPALPAGRLALVIDDFGHNLDDVALRAIHLPAPVTCAILPDRARSRRVLTEVRRAGKQALLHMPMEPEVGAPVGPGPVAVRVGMSSAEIRQIVAEGLTGLPGVVGVNNHMGSRATRSRAEMDAVMAEIAARGLIFLDSWTTPLTVAHLAATARGIPNLRNDMFIDVDTDDPVEIRRRLEKLLQIARERGWAVGIGHVHPNTITVLEEFLPSVDPADVQLVGLRELILDGARQPGS
ncbi:hypothetical protein DRQ53_02475 [bacterium]|nr:MAG: hypothetical protein DRQ53_02475 [bacterium]